jgi:hypothetical protein
MNNSILLREKIISEESSVISKMDKVITNIIFDLNTQNAINAVIVAINKMMLLFLNFSNDLEIISS